MRKALEIMRLKLNPADKGFPKLLSTQSAIASAVMSLTGRLDGSKLRGQSTDKIDALLREARGLDDPEEEVDPASLF